METEWFLKAKRLLQEAEEICLSANEILESSKDAFEMGVSLVYKMLFMIQELHSTVRILYGVEDLYKRVENSSFDDFRVQLQKFDTYGSLFEELIYLAKTKKIPKMALSPNLRNEKETSLYDILSFQDAENVKASIKEEIDFFQSTHTELSSYRKNFAALIVEKSEVLTSLCAEIVNVKLSALQNISKEEFVRIASQGGPTEHIHSIENNAQIMGGLLESLAHHYDQCSQFLYQSNSGNLKEIDSLSESKEEQLDLLRKDTDLADGVLDELYQRRDEMYVSSEIIAKFLETQTTFYQRCLKLHKDIGSLQVESQIHQKFSGEFDSFFSNCKDLDSKFSSLITWLEKNVREMDLVSSEMQRREKEESDRKRRLEVAIRDTEKMYATELSSRQRFSIESLPKSALSGLYAEPTKLEVSVITTNTTDLLVPNDIN
ncbi:autophagy-related protein 17 [Dipodascopsis uninucleata]